MNEHGLVGMSFDLKMDRPVVLDTDGKGKAHVVSPGSYEVRNGSDVVSFDFLDTAWNRDTDNPALLHIEQKNLDVGSFPKSASLTAEFIADAIFTDFFLFTGEKEDPEIRPVSVKRLELTFADGKIVRASTREVNKIVSLAMTIR